MKLKRMIMAAIGIVAAMTAFAKTPVASVVSEEACVLYSKAQTLTGLCMLNLYEADYGTATLKVGKINARTGLVKVTATIAPFDCNKKYTASANLEVDDEGYAYGTLPFKSPIGAMDVAISGETYEDERGKMVTELYFEGCNEDFGVYSAQVGGAFEADTLVCTAGELWESVDFGECWYAVAALDAEPIHVTRGTKWSFDKSPTLKYVRHREDGDTWYELEGFDERKPNVCGLKLSYTANTGVFKGSYYIYLSNAECLEDGKKPTLKKLKATVSGIVVEGTGRGAASVKIGRETWSWPIYIEPCEDWEEEEEDDPGCIFCGE